jgi:hypothetical protein
VLLLRSKLRLSSSPSLDLSQNLDDLALGHFFHQYVFKYPEQGHNWHITDGNGCLLSAIKALGEAGVRKRRGLPPSSLDTTAQKHYGDAIQKVNAALRSPESAKRDSTLLAIIILGIFENLNGYQRNLDCWRGHVNGAASLIHLRGTEQFRTQQGCRLFFQTCQNMILACISRRIAIPPHVRAMQKEAERYVSDANESVWRFHMASMKVAELNARLLPGNYPISSEHAQSVVQDGLTLFLELDCIAEEAPPDWRPRWVGATGPGIFADYYYAFESYIVAQIFGGIWSFKIMLVDILRKALANLRTSGRHGATPTQVDLIHDAIASTRQLQLDILATIPQHLRDIFPITHTPDPDAAKAKLSTSFNNTGRHLSPFRDAPKADRDLPFVRMTGGTQVQFPLFTAGAADPPGGAIRTWVINILRTLSNNANFPLVSRKKRL